MPKATRKPKPKHIRRKPITEPESVNEIELSITPGSKAVFTIEAGKEKGGKIPVRIRVEGAGGEENVQETASQPQVRFEALRKRLMEAYGRASAFGKTIGVGTAFFLVAMGVYIFTRLYALDQFPIYFFTDEAVQTLFAETLIRNKFVGTDGTFLPMYVEAEGFRWTPLLPMYIHALTTTLFGKSIFITRAASAIVSILAPFAAALLLKKVFRAKMWWTVVFFLGITPAWLLHSRTAFETVMTTAFYSCFILSYLLYRTQSPKFIYLALVFGVATFYSYSNAQAIVALLALLLFIVDFRYHWEHKRALAGGLALALVLAYPLISFEIRKPTAISDHLQMINTYWFQSIPFTEKIGLFLQKFTYGLSPMYWFFPNTQDLPRHRMAGYGQIHTAVLPLFLIGLAVSLTKIKSIPHRTVLLAALATPIGASLIDVGITRVLAFVVPANILIVLGLEWLADQIKGQKVFQVLNVALFIGLVFFNFRLLNTALTKGPLWFDDYGLYGMQWGARQLFEEALPPILKEEKDTQVLMSSSWANGTEKYLDFFLSPADQERVRMDSIETYLFRQQPLTSDMLFVMTPSEFEKAAESPKFIVTEVEQIIPYPNGMPGFYLARVEYAPNAEDIFAAEKAERSIPLEETFDINGEEIRFVYSMTDMGEIPYMFDGNDFTLIRGMEANPFKLEMYFTQARPLDGLEIRLGSANLEITVSLYESADSLPVVYNALKAEGEMIVTINFNKGPQTVAWMRLEFLDRYSGDTANIHIWDLQLLP